ncbi:biotin-dependent carboxylase-like uncharacterized protein [Barrientosiimonas humi]|uniref:Biotin-dependent carboxylase-like uncharacterized protein n=1 Tax=Barrientosiimonas humi TaxID=999931 RepID=A0A542X8V1_9MICO|nr:biotin-dependent carboxyltransferase family protein [Barrientosiimonas humi]TQL32263.1 biotin-dependent carboxylase-like uncharacterized protein [Barrientosiimonas humi]CAG7572251.1 KipI antagonist [Barrientosiimonas humi]
MSLLVEQVDRLALVEDLGRPGHRALGVPPSGAADRTTLRALNRLLGNDPGAAAVETLLGGLRLQVEAPVTVAVGGAPCVVTVDDQQVGLGLPVALAAGQTLTLGAASAGLRTYLAVRGGVAESVDVPTVLGSLSSDPTSGLGPAPLRPGVRLEVGRPAGSVAVDRQVAPFALPTTGLTLGATWGPRADWLTDASRDRLDGAWTVSADTDRVGVRLDGPALDRSRDDQLPSEGVVRGCVQVPPDGRPIVFLADHPTTGGYPVVAVLDPAETDLLAQLTPGTDVRLRLRPSRLAGIS